MREIQVVQETAGSCSVRRCAILIVLALTVHGTRSLSMEELGKWKGTAQQMLAKALEFDRWPAFTQNDSYLDDVRTKWLRRYKDARRAESRWLLPTTPDSEDEDDGNNISAALAEALEALANANYGRLTQRDLVALLPQDVFEQELILMAKVRAYFEVACKVLPIPFLLFLLRCERLD